MQDQATCQCGCGAPAPLAKRTTSRYGHVKGQALRFINGHNTRKSRSWTVVQRDYDTPCWEWDGTLNAQGYGVLRIDYRQIKAHRWVYEQQRGEIPGGLALDHLCSNHCCVNPDHLEPVTSAENSRRYWAEHGVQTRRDVIQ